MKIAYFILNIFDSDSRARLEVETLGSMGHQVEIIATEGADSSSYLGFPIHRVPQWYRPWRKLRFIQYNILAAGIGRKISADIFHAVDLDTLQAAVWASGGRHPIVYESRELYTELEALNGRPTTKNIWQSLERGLITKAARVITINDSLAAELCARYGIQYPTVVRNVAVLPKNHCPADIREIYTIPKEWKIIIYQGVMRYGQGLSYLLEIMTHLEKTALLLVGAGPIEDELREQAALMGIPHKVIFTGMVPPDELATYTSACHAGILLMEDVALNNRLALPQKLFQYVACGLPQIVSPMPEIRKFVEDNKTGIVVPLNDAPAAAHMIYQLLNDDVVYYMASLNSQNASLNHNWERESAKLKALYADLVSQP